MNDKLDIKIELYRKLIHIFSTIIPVIYYFNSKEFILSLVGVGTVMMIALDILKAYTVSFEKLYKMFFHVILREDEKDYKRNLFTGGTYYAIGIFLALLFFPKEVAILSILIMIWCDTVAALVGKTFGKKRIVEKKTLEGSIAFTITGFILLFILQFVFPDYNFYKAGFITVLFAAIFEQLSILKINDNLSLPLFSGIVFIIINSII